MNPVIAPLARIILRYVAGYLIARGFAHDPNAIMNPDTEMVLCWGLAALFGGGSEAYWWVARRRGWAR